MSEIDKNSSIEILVVNHKPSYIPENSLLKPIQVGTALSESRLDGMAYFDNNGDNISKKNKSYCELTAIYWAWKNLKVDYIGLFHYRRYLSFAPDTFENPYPGKAFPDIQSSLNTIHLNEDDMRGVIEQYDVIVPRKDDTKSTTRDSSIYEQYANEHFIKDLDYCIKYIEKNHPKISPFLSSLHTSRAYFCNMFVMKKEIFNEYCSFIFDVLESFEKNVDISNYNQQQYRVIGYLAERLTNVYIHYLINNEKIKVKELQIAYFENTDPIIKLSPVSDKNNIGIVLASDNEYVPYVSTMLHSLVENATETNIYDINIFHQNITLHNQTKLINEFKEKKNLSIRFYDMRPRLAEFINLATKWHITVETYFRLFIPEIMDSYNKVLYLDSDVIVKRDVADVFNVDLDGYLLGACRDVDMAGVYSSNLVMAENNINPDMKFYLEKILKLNHPYDYFQAGVLVLNLAEIRKSFSTSQLLDISTERKWEYLDQDVLNYIAAGRVKFLNQKWNVLYDWEYQRIKNVISKAPRSLFEEYLISREDPYIIHFGGTVKPWQRADADFAEEFWRAARKSIFYEIIISRMSIWAQENSNLQRTRRESIRIRTRIIRFLRNHIDIVAPKGTLRRRTITFLSNRLKRIL